MYIKRCEDAMRILVIGLGSMGRRRARLLRKIDPNINIVGIDNNGQRRADAEKEYAITTAADLDEALAATNADAAVISTSPLQHAHLIQKCLEFGLHVFTELNLTPDLYEENICLAKAKDRVLFLSSTFLYRDEISHIRRRVADCAKPLNYSYHIGQYLSDWHPWESYKNYFVSDSRTNACREIFAIEIPWLRKTFGEIRSFNVISSKVSSLDIDYPDTYHLILNHSSGTVGSLNVDVVTRKAVRNLEVYGEELYISWNGSPTGLFEFDFLNKRDQRIELYEDIDTLDGYSSFVIENAYQNELQRFLEQISGTGCPEYTFEDDLTTLQLIDRFEGLCNDGL